MKQTWKNLRWKREMAGPAGLVLGLLLGLVGLAWWLFRLPYEQAYIARTEEGIVERMSAGFWILAVLIAVGLAVLRRWKRGWFGAGFFTLLCLRELDFHSRFTPENITSTRYWRSGEVVVLEKVLVFLILVGWAWAVFRFLRGGLPWLRGELIRGRAHAVTIVGLFGFACIPYLLDNILDMSDLENPRTLFLSLLEESVELGIPVLLCLALLQWGCAGGVDRKE